MSDVSLKDYVESRIDDLDKRLTGLILSQKEAVEIAFASSEKAVVVAENNAERWRENANEWRSAMSDREREFVRQVQHQTEVNGLRKDVQDLKERVDKGEGTGAGLRAGWGYLVAVIVAAAAVVALFLKHT